MIRSTHQFRRWGHWRDPDSLYLQWLYTAPLLSFEVYRHLQCSSFVYISYHSHQGCDYWTCDWDKLTVSWAGGPSGNEVSYKHEYQCLQSSRKLRFVESDWPNCVDLDLWVHCFEGTWCEQRGSVRCDRCESFLLPIPVMKQRDSPTWRTMG